MKTRQSYFENFPTSTLIIILEQRQKELNEINSKLENCRVKKTPQLKKRKNDLEFIIRVVRKLLIERYLKADVSLFECCQIIVYGKGIKKELFKDIFVYQLIKKEEPIDYNLLEQAINELELNQIQTIMHTQQNNVFGELANKKFDEVIFEIGRAHV